MASKFCKLNPNEKNTIFCSLLCVVLLTILHKHLPKYLLTAKAFLDLLVAYNMNHAF